MTATKTIIGIGSLILAIIVILVVTSQFLGSTDSLTNNNTVTTSYIDGILAANGSAQTLSVTPTSSPVVTARNNTWLDFDGTDDYISNIVSICIDNSSCTYTFWIRTNFTETTSKGNIMYSNGSREIYIADSNLIFGIANGTNDENSVSTNQYIYDNDWYSLVFTQSGNSSGDANISIYIDGIFVNNSLVINGSETGAVSDIGNDSNSFNGSIADFRQYSIALPAANITEINKSGIITNSSIQTDDLTVYFPFNENSGTSVYSLNSTLDSTAYSSVISGATWNTNGADDTLTSNTDYNVSGSTFTILNVNYAYSELNVSYDRSETGNIGFSMQGNFTKGLDNLSEKIPTILLVVAVVILLGVLVLLMKSAKDVSIGETGAL